MPYDTLNCPHCGQTVCRYRNPFPTVDIIIEYRGGIVLIERNNEPKGWALPGGFVDYGESLETAAIREAKEETGLIISRLVLLGCYSDPARDPRQHNISTVFVATGEGMLQAGDDAGNAAVFALSEIPGSLCFDHDRIIRDYRAWKSGKTVIPPV